MNLHDLVSQFIVDTTGLDASGWFTAASSLGRFRPELVLCATIVALLGVRIVRSTRRFDVSYVALIGALVALYAAAPWKLLAPGETFVRTEIFTGLLVYDGFTVFIRGLLLLFLVLFVILTKLSGIPDREDGADIYTLVFGSTLGMCLMASANHLLIVFLAVEMSSVPSYALAGMLKGRKLGSEAALKYAVYGAGAAGILLYGISLLAGMLHSAHLPTIAVQLARMLPDMPAPELMVLALGGLMVAAGLAFKLSAFPFHFWCPDVFEGATAEVDAFLSISSKAAALALLVRVALGFGTVPAGELAAVAAAPPVAQTAGLYAIVDDVQSADTAVGEVAPVIPVDAMQRLAPVRTYIALLISALAIVTCTFGNLAAYGQTNIKRLLAYSTIAHAGYMMMAVPPLLALAQSNPASAQSAVAGLAIYLAVYLFMNLGAFSVVAFLRNEMRSEQIQDYAGLIRRCPGVVICLATMLLSLVGLPPLAGFIGKFAIFAALADAYRETADGYLITLLVVGGLNTVLSLFYYLNVVRIMTMAPEPESRRPFTLPLVSLPGMFVLAVTLPTALLIVGWNGLGELALAAARHLLAV